VSIATLDALLAGMRPPEFFSKVVTPTLVAGRPQSLWYLAGVPGPGAAAANTAGGVALSSTSALVAGQIRHVDGGGSAVSYLARFVGGATIAGQLLLCDRLMQVCGDSGGTALSVTSTSAQTVNSGTLPSRDIAGSANGDGVLWALEIAATMGSGAGNAPTISYTDQGGTSGNAAALIDPYAASSALGVFYRFGLAAGDTGAKSVQTFTNSATMTTGTISLVAYRVLASLEFGAAQTPNALDALTGCLPKLQNGVVPFLVFIPSTTTATAVTGQYVESQG